MVTYQYTGNITRQGNKIGERCYLLNDFMLVVRFSIGENGENLALITTICLWSHFGEKPLKSGNFLMGIWTDLEENRSLHKGAVRFCYNRL